MDGKLSQGIRMGQCLGGTQTSDQSLSTVPFQVTWLVRPQRVLGSDNLFLQALSDASQRWPGHRSLR